MFINYELLVSMLVLYQIYFGIKTGVGACLISMRFIPMAIAAVDGSKVGGRGKFLK